MLRHRSRVMDLRGHAECVVRASLTVRVKKGIGMCFAAETRVGVGLCANRGVNKQIYRRQGPTRWHL